ncbi:hypothetical protein CKALI_01635 [Corynebacterium kalinowskii]|uniref:DUF3263 domain-containing protein n=1 Tax=Corynebacterium kalinowskii TaxID=2675216 RepID=A0A6B8VR39_9CORY|nr:DUF3263 domain-containing protein [Corynebacterium kalinowskii]QGU01226.1 hypothetical protein CKALI_01635 [Corynebacterium kalinowskii]
MPLSEADRTLLEFESRAPRNVGAKEEAIRAELGITPVRYFHRLNALIDDPAAVAEFPVLVHRLERIRHQRANLRY